MKAILLNQSQAGYNLKAGIKNILRSPFGKVLQIALLLLCIDSSKSFAQTPIPYISGPTEVYGNQTDYYTLQNVPNNLYITWTVTHGRIVGQAAGLNQTYTYVQWDADVNTATLEATMPNNLPYTFSDLYVHKGPQTARVTEKNMADGKHVFITFHREAKKPQATPETINTETAR